MRQTLLVLCLLFPIATATKGANSRGAPLRIYHLTGNFYVYVTHRPIGGSPFPSNSMYLVTESGIVMFDTPWDTTQFQPLLDSIERRHHKPVVCCISTHFHSDRTAGLAFLKQKGIRTYSSQYTRDLCKKHGEHQAEFTFANDTAFRVGNYSFQTYYPGAGHSPDNIVIWFPHERVLYGGCLVKSTENDGLGNLSDADLTHWAPSIRNVIKKFPNPAYVIPGHFSWKNRQSLQHTLKLLSASK